MKYTETEKNVQEMLKSSKSLHGLARDIAFDMALREMWEQEQKKKGEA